MTKTITATYHTTTTLWAIRDNGQVILEGRGLNSWAKALSCLRVLTDKPINTKTVR